MALVIGPIADVIRSDEPVTWCFIGDSVTAGMRYTHGARSYPELFHERLRELERVLDTVVNTAVSGWRVTDLLNHLERIALRFDPDVVLIGIGLNDTKGGDEGLPRFAQEYEELVRTLRRHGSHVVCQVPSGTLATAPGYVVRHLDSYSDAIRHVARVTGAELVDHAAAWGAVDGGSVEERFGRGCHPNALGHRAMARTLIEAAASWSPTGSRVAGLLTP